MGWFEENAPEQVASGAPADASRGRAVRDVRQESDPNANREFARRASRGVAGAGAGALPVPPALRPLLAGLAGGGMETFIQGREMGMPVVGAPPILYNPGAAANAFEDEAALQALGEAGAGGARWGAQTMMQHALRPSAGLRGTAQSVAEREAGGRLKRSNVRMAQQAIEQRVGPGARGRSTLFDMPDPRLSTGSVAVQEQMDKAMDEVGRLLDVADARGAVLTRKQVLAPLRAYRDRLAGTGARDAEVRTVTEFLSEYERKLPSTLSPQQVQTLKQEWYKQAKPTFAVDTGGQGKATRSADNKAAKAAATGARDALESRAIEGRPANLARGQFRPEIGPKVAELNAEYARLDPLQRALRQAELRDPARIPWTPIAAPSGMVAGTALNLTDPFWQLGFANMPRTLAGALGLGPSDVLPIGELFNPAESESTTPPRVKEQR